MRVFLAIDFPEEIKKKCLNKINICRKSFAEFRWIKKPALHLTLKFIGEVEEALIPEINTRLKDAFVDIEPFDLSTSITGFFPSPKKARVFFLDLYHSADLEKCYKIIEDELETLGIEREQRKFHPHITLARIKKRPPSQEEAADLLKEDIEEMTIPVNEIILMQSELLPSGARYTPVQRFSLRTT